MAEIRVDAEGMESAIQEVDAARLSYQRAVDWIDAIRADTVACAGEDEYKKRFFEGEGGMPGAGGYLDWLRTACEASANSCGVMGETEAAILAEAQDTEQNSATDFN